MLDNLPNAELTRAKAQNERQEKLKIFKQQLCSQIITKIQKAVDDGRTYAEITYTPFYDEVEIEDIILKLKEKGYKVIKPKNIINAFAVDWR